MSDLRGDRLLNGVPEIEGKKVLGKCVLYAKLGEGGMGVVYRGRHLNLDVEVAVKCLPPRLAQEDQEFVVRFEREAKIAARIKSENLVQVYDVDEESDLHFIVMEYVAGENAAERLERKGGRLDPAEAATIALGAARGLSVAHQKGVVHRDIKPGNILISTDGVVKVADLGLARAADSVDSMRTKSHMNMGTPNYMPPEQFGDAKNVGPAADVYSLGATLWHFLIGEAPYSGSNVVGILRRMGTEGLAKVADLRPEVPTELSEIVACATDEKPQLRFPDAGAMVKALEAFLRKIGQESNLADPDAGKLKSSATVSPPPMQELARIKIAAKAAQTPKPTGPTAAASPLTPSDKTTTKNPTFDPIAEGTTKTPTATPREKKRSPAMMAFLALIVANLGFAIWWTAFRPDPYDGLPRKPFNGPETILRDQPWGETIGTEYTTDGFPKRVRDRATGIVMVYVPGGTFMMGSPATEAERDSDEDQHQETVAAFYCAECEMTQGQWKAITGSNPAHFKNGDEYPVEQVSWDDITGAGGFLSKVNAQTSNVGNSAMRLPSEIEWEYACRAGTTTPFSFGTTITPSQVNYDGNYPYGGAAKGLYREKTVPVRSLPANAFGLYEMHGNVREWCQDLYHGQAARVLRGGSWDNIAVGCRSADRFWLDPAVRFNDYGFRVVRTPF